MITHPRRSVILPAPSPSGYHYHDIDTRPKTHVCEYCARDVENGGKKCSCVPSQPLNAIIR